MTILDRQNNPLTSAADLGMWDNSDAWRVPDVIIHNLAQADDLSVSAGPDGEVVVFDDKGEVVELEDAIGQVYGIQDDDEPVAERIPAEFMDQATSRIAKLVMMGSRRGSSNG